MTDGELERVADEVREFWDVAQVKARLNDLEIYTSVTGLRCPAAASVGLRRHPEQADALLALVLDGTKTATAGALWDYEALEEEVPAPGDLAIILDGAAAPGVDPGMTESSRAHRPGQRRTPRR